MAVEEESVQIPSLPEGTTLRWFAASASWDRIEPIAFIECRKHIFDGYNRELDAVICHFLEQVGWPKATSWEWTSRAAAVFRDSILAETREEALELTRIAREVEIMRWVLPEEGEN